MNKLLTLFLCVLGLQLAAQNLDKEWLSREGYAEFYITVQDSETMALLPNVAVRLENRQTGTKQTATTDSNGQAIIIEKLGCEYDAYVGKSRSAQRFGFPMMPNKAVRVPLAFYAEEQADDQPQDNEVLLQLRIKDYEQRPQADFAFNLRDKQTGKITQLKTDNNGFVQVIQRSGATLEVSFDKAPHYTDVLMPNRSHFTYAYDLLVPTATQRAQWQLFPEPTKALFIFEFKDMKGNLVEGEEFSVSGGTINDKASFTRTNSAGFAQLLLPAGGTRNISHTRNPNFRAINTDWKTASDVQVYFINYTSISEAQHKAYEDYLLELQTYHDSLNAVAEAERRAFEAKLREELRAADSLKRAEILAAAAEKLARAAEKTEPTPTPSPTVTTTTPSAVVTTTSPSIKTNTPKTTTSLKIDMDKISYPKQIERYAAAYAEAIKADPKIFEREGYTVLAVLQRMDNEWNNKMIVTDVTGSMMPYINQVLVWHALKNAQNETDNYVFFNDGDERKTHHKVIGITEGIYGVRSNKLDDIYNTMMTTCLRGDGGDRPENDVEALLYAQKYSLRDTSEHLILVADALSPVRDISLITKLQKPVRVILCGAPQPNGTMAINVEYFIIAAQTNGSVHTIEEDILDINKVPEDGIISVGGRDYIRKNGAFIPVEIPKNAK